MVVVLNSVRRSGGDVSVVGDLSSVILICTVLDYFISSLPHW